jgi:hypothetical protein
MYVYDPQIKAMVFQIKTTDSRPLDVRLGEARHGLRHTAGKLIDQLAKQHMHTHSTTYEAALDVVMRADPKLTRQYREGV